jgi:hypothetical protein
MGRVKLTVEGVRVSGTVHDDNTETYTLDVNFATVAAPAAPVAAPAAPAAAAAPAPPAVAADAPVAAPAPPAKSAKNWAALMDEEDAQAALNPAASEFVPSEVAPARKSARTNKQDDAAESRPRFSITSKGIFHGETLIDTTLLPTMDALPADAKLMFRNEEKGIKAYSYKGKVLFQKGNAIKVFTPPSTQRKPRPVQSDADFAF